MSSYTYETVLGTITEEKLGYTQPHEHIYIVGTKDQEINKLICMNVFPSSRKELEIYRKAGGNTVTDANPLATGRDALALRDLSRLTGVNIIATTGYHLQKFYPSDHWIWNTEEEKLADLFADEIENGMYEDGFYFWPEVQTNCKAGLVKAIMTDEGLDDPWTKKCLSAAGSAAVRTGTPIMIHTEYGKDSLRAVDLLAGKIGVPENKILICHADRQAEDFSIHEEIAKTGVFMEYDTITLFRFHDNASEIRLIRHMAEKGFLDRILISTDPETDRMKAYGGIVGMDYILTSFIPLLKLSGFTEDDILQITRRNPAAALAKF